MEKKTEFKIFEIPRGKTIFCQKKPYPLPYSCIVVVATLPASATTRGGGVAPRRRAPLQVRAPMGRSPASKRHNPQVAHTLAMPLFRASAARTCGQVARRRRTQALPIFAGRWPVGVTCHCSHHCKWPAYYRRPA